MINSKETGVPTYDNAELDEPLFVLRAQDQIAPIIVELYAIQATIMHAPPGLVARVRRIAGEMRRWQMLHPTKLPGEK